MAYLTHLNALQAVEAAIRNGSLAGAANELGITPAAVGQRIRGLEDFLETPLLDRSRHSFAPTPALEAALSQLSEGFASLGAAAETLQLQVSHTIHVAADADWAALWLEPRLDKFLAAFPQISVEINSGLRAADFSVTAGDPDRPGADMLYTDYWLPVASQDVVRRTEGFPAERQLEGLPLLHFEPFGQMVRGIGWPEWIRLFGHRLTGHDRGFRYRWITQALDAARCDVGFLLVGLSLVETQLMSGALRQPFPIEEGVWMEEPYVLHVRPGTLKRPQARKFHDWLLAVAAETRSGLAAQVGRR